MAYLNIKMKFSKQGDLSSNCGPCSLKMLADFYQIQRKNNISYTQNSLNRLCRVKKNYGCEKSDMNRVLKKWGLKKHPCPTPQDVRFHLKKKRPLLALFIEETGEGHYALLKGETRNEYIFHDSFWGKNIKRDKKKFRKQLKYFGHWLWAIENPLKS